MHSFLFYLSFLATYAHSLLKDTRCISSKQRWLKFTIQINNILYDDIKFDNFETKKIASAQKLVYMIQLNLTCIF